MFEVGDLKYLVEDKGIDVKHWVEKMVRGLPAIVRINQDVAVLTKVGYKAWFKAQAAELDKMFKISAGRLLQVNEVDG